jgi:predicted secreted hydrolase
MLAPPRQRQYGYALGLLALVALSACGDAERASVADAPAQSLTQRLGGDADGGFARALEPRAFDFPHDHGPHRAYRNEWWYITGNLDGERGRRYGFQITFFRTGLAPGSVERASRWATHEVWMAHLAVTDAHRGRFRHHERFARGGAIGLAGAEREPVRVWLEDWRLWRQDSGAWRLRAAKGELRLDLELEPAKPPVLNGDGGLSRKGPEPGQASYYYALPRLQADGWLRSGGHRTPVDGRAWLDREWSTSALGPDQAGWDWFALQLDDGTDVMIYRLRRDDATTSRYSAATVTPADGPPRRLAAHDFELEVTRRWANPRGGTYPAGWRLAIDGRETVLTVTPVMADQELEASVRYWEGAVDVHADGQAVGRGYVELTGYATGD